MTIIRDFAYQPDDNRYSGIYPDDPVLKAKSEEIEIADDDASSSDDEVEENDWEFEWSSRPKPLRNKEKKGKTKTSIHSKNTETNIVALTQFSSTEFNTQILQEFTQILKKRIEDVDIETLKGYRTIFPFVKGTDYEMSLEPSDITLVVVLKQKESQKPEKSDNQTGSTGERWSSIDVLAEAEQTKELHQQLKLLFDPTDDVVAKEILQFLGYNKNYGDGWVTALKIKVFGSWKKGEAKIILKDIGLIPGNYIEPCNWPCKSK